MSDFDPYLQWLGIQPHERPPDHYRLLGLPRFEANPIVVQNAADERMALVRVYQTGPRAAYTQHLLNELAAAKLCLLDAYSKAEYDSSLSAGTARVADTMLPASVPSPFVPPEHEPQCPIVLASRHASHATGSRLAILGWIFGAIAVACIIWGAKNVLDPGSTGRNPPGDKAVDAQKNVAVGAAGDDGQPTHDAGLITQEATGFVIFPMAAATLRGQTAFETLDIGQLLVGWQTEEDRASWRFQIRKLPSQGIFRVRVVYQASGSAEGAAYILDLDGVEQSYDVRARDRLVEDEFYLSVKRGGEHTLTFSVRNLPGTASFGLKLLEYSIPRVGHTGGE